MDKKIEFQNFVSRIFILVNPEHTKSPTFKQEQLSGTKYFPGNNILPAGKKGESDTALSSTVSDVRTLAEAIMRSSVKARKWPVCYCDHSYFNLGLISNY